MVKIMSLVEIDGRCWFAEDLRTTQDRNGTAIPEITDEGYVGGFRC